MKARLDTAFDSWGHFSQDMAGKSLIPGRLSWDPQAGIRLELVRSPLKEGMKALVSAQSFFVLYGWLAKGMPATLFDCLVSHVEMWDGGMGSPTVIVCNRLLLGTHAEDLNELRVKSASAELSSLASWMCPIPMDYEHKSTGQDEFAGFDLAFRRPEPIEVAVPATTLGLKFSYGWETQHKAGSFGAEWHAGATVVAQSSMTYSEAERVSYQCSNLMSLLIGDRLSRRAFTMAPAESPSDDETGGTLRLIVRQVGPHDLADLHPAEMTLPYSLIKEVFPGIVEQWFTRSEQAKLATNLFFGSQLFDGLPADVRFRAATQAAEAYHRSLGTGIYMDQDDYRSAIEGLLSQIPQALEPDHRKSLKNRLEYGNEHSLRKRLMELLARLPSDAGQLIAGKASAFVNRVVCTRNYLTHYDLDAKRDAFRDDETYTASGRLHILVVASLLNDLGIGGELLVTALKRNRRYQGWLSAELEL